MLDRFLVLIPSIDDDDWNPREEDIQNISAIKQFTHTFAAPRDFLFPPVIEVPVAALGEQFSTGLEQVGSLGWELKAQANKMVEHFVSIGRRDKTLWFLNVKWH